MEQGVLYKLQNYGVFDDIPLVRSTSLDNITQIFCNIIEDSYGIDDDIKHYLNTSYTDLINGDIEHSRNNLDFILADIEEANDFSDSSDSEYRTFSEDFEDSLYRYLSDQNGELKKIIIPGLRFSELYFVKAFLEIELEDKDAAVASYEKAVRWNPISSPTLNDYALLCWEMKNYDKACELTIRRLNASFRRVDIADCYTKLGLYYRKQEEWQNAFECFHKALGYEDDINKQVQLHSLIKPILDILDPVDDIEIPEDKSYDSKFPVPEDNHMAYAQLAYRNGGYCLVTEQYDRIAYYWEIAYDISRDNQIEQLLDLLSEGRVQEIREMIL